MGLRLGSPEIFKLCRDIYTWKRTALSFNLLFLRLRHLLEYSFWNVQVWEVKSSIKYLYQVSYYVSFNLSVGREWKFEEVSLSNNY